MHCPVPMVEILWQWVPLETSSWAPSLFPHPSPKSSLPYPPALRPQELHVLARPLGPPRPISQTHGDPLDAPAALWGHLQVPVIETTQPQEPHLPQQPPCPPGPIPAATKNPLGVTSALGTSRLRPPASTAPPPLPPHCAPLVGRAPLPVIGPQHPLPPSRWHQSHSCQCPWAPRAAPPAPRGASTGPPLPGRGAGGLRWVPVAHAGCE